MCPAYDFKSQVVREHTNEEGVVNHLTLANSLKHQLPTVFQLVSQYAATGCVSSNTEAFFSRTGVIQDDHKSMGEKFMQNLSFISGQTNKPTTEEVKEKYMELFRGHKSKEVISEDEEEEEEEDEDDDEEYEDLEDDLPLDATEPRLLPEVGEPEYAEATNVAAAGTAAL
jgi:hypothetical protein